MEKIIWSQDALDDLNSIYSYIAEDSEFYARRVVVSLYERLNILPEQPYIGRIVPEKNIPEIREIIEGNYRILYSIAKLPQVVIYRILHRSRLFK